LYLRGPTSKGREGKGGGKGKGEGTEKGRRKSDLTKSLSQIPGYTPLPPQSEKM